MHGVNDIFKFSPNLVAVAFNSSEPKTVMISARAVKSSGALKNGYMRDRMHRKITPAAHMSTAERLLRLRFYNI